jgi:sterol desaturase/sphingolipid hydroxylase (fatty acid hydroxylase superfamily)
MVGKNYIIASSVIFGIVSLLHLWRAVSNLPLNVGVWELPVWLSYLAFIFIGFLSYWGFKLGKK